MLDKMQMTPSNDIHMQANSGLTFTRQSLPSFREGWVRMWPELQSDSERYGFLHGKSTTQYPTL